MTTRPDLDAIRQRRDDWEPYLARDEHWSAASITLLFADLDRLLTYCRELEEENKRLRERADELEYYANHPPEQQA